MCGRFTLTTPAEALEELFSVEAIDAFPPRYNIAPTQPILIVRGGAERGGNRSGRETLLVRWGFIPGWIKDLRSFPLLINARSETAAEKNAFRGAMKYRRCLVPASGFYEWRRDGKARSQPFFLRPASGRPIAFAGLFETWLGPDGSEIDTGAILTTAANRTLAPIHDRMPVVVEEKDFERWLDCRNVPAGEIGDILTQAPDGLFDIVAVSDRVNKVANMGPDLQEPVADAAGKGEDPASPPEQAAFRF